MIKLQVIGNLGKDATVNNVNGKNVINFTVAHTEKFKDAQGNQKERTTWVDCAYWTDRTAITPYLKKGTQVYVEGTPDVRTYTKQDGTNGAALTLRIANVQLLGNRPQEGNTVMSSTNSGNYGKHETTSVTVQQPEQIGEPLEDLPF
ncbi:MAG: single-stranded DNA-binding protein [Bacteroidetes bacterium]|nr:single-stranded DNA-binding protein [Bacteroidota bacterium]MBS1649522.1 single-stranded DNA-binding protein [Bacteroidota bacterium]